MIVGAGCRIRMGVIYVIKVIPTRWPVDNGVNVNKRDKRVFTCSMHILIMNIYKIVVALFYFTLIN